MYSPFPEYFELRFQSQLILRIPKPVPILVQYLMTSIGKQGFRYSAVKHILSTFVLSSLSALANPAPLPNLSYTGNNRFIQLNSYIAPAAEGGGQFAGTVAYQNQSI